MNTPEALNNVDEELLTYAKEMPRHEFLPLLFRIKGKPYSLKDYPQFSEMYGEDYAPDTIWMCGRQIGKSLNLSRSEVLDAIQIPHLQLLYVAPLQAQTQRYSTLYLKESINSCFQASDLQIDGTGASDSPIVKSVMHQSFGNGSSIQLTYAKTSSDRARGITADRIDFDEIQDQLVDNIPIISESLTSSHWGLRRFTGTAKTTDNTIESLWQQSSMCEWVMKCSHCNYWNIPNLDGKVLDLVQADGIRCVKCGGRLNVREGEFVPTYPDRMFSFRGYHIPQIVIPAIVENPTKWSGILRKISRLPIATVLQEVMGISCSLGSRLITQADIDRQCVLPSMLELQGRINNYVWTVGGIDWGIGETQSFTVHTIIGIRPDGGLDVLWARRFAGFDPDETLRQIAQAHNYYGCRMLAADFGMGFDKNIMLENRFGLSVVQMQYVAQNKLLGYNPLLGQHRWTVDRTTAMELVFLAIKYGKIQFPRKDDMLTFAPDLLSPYEEVVEVGGIGHRRFARNPSVPDDFFHALTFGSMLAMKLMNSSILDIVPTHAMGALRQAGNGTAPTIDHVDPRDIMAAAM